MVDLILNNFLVPNVTRIEAIKCFTEVVSIPLAELTTNDQRVIKEKICLYFCYFIQKITEITKNRSLFEEY
jgi:hypothetical protein